jgi:hypothetical protein
MFAEKRAAGLMKLFIHEILPPSVKKAIFVDSDSILIANPRLMWEIWDSAKPSTAFIMARWASFFDLPCLIEIHFAVIPTNMRKSGTTPPESAAVL